MTISADPPGIEYYFDDQPFPWTTDQKDTWGWLMHNVGEDAQTLGGGAGVTIAFISYYGIRTDHEDLIGKLDYSLSYDFSGYGLYSTTPFGVYALDTAMMGILVALDNSVGARGLVPNANFALIRETTTGGTIVRERTLEYVMDHANDIDILYVNAPNGQAEDYESLESLFQQVRDSGIVTVVPVGAAGYNMQYNYIYPAVFPSVIPVAGTGPYFSKVYPDERTFYSAYSDNGVYVELSGPCASIRAPHKESTSTYYPAQVTITAAAHVVAVFAILKSRYPDYSVERLIDIARATAINNTTYYNDKKPDDPRTYWDPWQGWGYATIGGPVEWGNEEIRVSCEMNLELSPTVELMTLNVPSFEMTLSMRPMEIVFKIIAPAMSLSCSISAALRLLWNLDFQFKNHLQVNKEWRLVNSLHGDVEKTFSAVNDIIGPLEKQFGIKLNINDLVKISHGPKFIMSLMRDGANYGAFELDEGHDG